MPRSRAVLTTKKVIEEYIRNYPEQYCIAIFPDGAEELHLKKHAVLGYSYCSLYWDDKRIEIVEISGDGNTVWYDEVKHA